MIGVLTGCINSTVSVWAFRFHNVAAIRSIGQNYQLEQQPSLISLWHICLAFNHAPGWAAQLGFIMFVVLGL